MIDGCQVALASLAESVHRASHTVTEVSRKRSQENSARAAAERELDQQFKKLRELCDAAAGQNILVPTLSDIMTKLSAARSGPSP